MIILSPSGSYYAAGLNPVKIAVEDEYVRAVRGGTGFAKVGGNYAASLIGQQKAEERGYAQVLWLDGIHHKYIDEVGAMNVFFVINGEIITPALEGSILPGVTRLSAIELLRNKGYKVTERRISIDEVYDAYKQGTLEEMRHRHRRGVSFGGTFLGRQGMIQIFQNLPFRPCFTKNDHYPLGKVR